MFWRNVFWRTISGLPSSTEKIRIYQIEDSRDSESVVFTKRECDVTFLRPFIYWPKMGIVQKKKVCCEGKKHCSVLKQSRIIRIDSWNLTCHSGNWADRAFSLYGPKPLSKHITKTYHFNKPRLLHYISCRPWALGCFRVCSGHIGWILWFKKLKFVLQWLDFNCNHSPTIGRTGEILYQLWPAI